MARPIAGSEIAPESVASFVPGWAAQGDEAALRRLLRATPMPGPVRLALEREPNFFRAPQLEWERHYTAVARESSTGEIFAMCSRSVRKLFLNGAPTPLGYLSQLRISPGHRAHKLGLLKMGFKWLEGTRQPAEAPFDITTVVENNSSARRLLTAQLPGLPTYSELEPMLTLLFPVKHHRHKDAPAITRGHLSLLEPIVASLQRFGRRHQFAPYWTAADFSPTSETHPKGPGRQVRAEDFLVARRGDRLAGCVALWDQRKYKQVVIQGYNGALAWSHRILRVLGTPLPLPGSVLPMAWLSHLALDDDDPNMFECLIKAAMASVAKRSDIQWLALMLAARHPLLRAAHRFGGRAYRSILFAVHPSGTKVNLDGCIPYVEGALL